MEAIIVFLRDTLDGLTYVLVSVVCFILIIFCIWQLILRSKKKRAAHDEFLASNVVIINDKGQHETIKIVPSVAKSSISTTVNSESSVSSVTTLPQNNNVKPVVMINPLEVAAVSSTMNIIASGSSLNTSKEDKVGNSTNSVQGNTDTNSTSTNSTSNSQNFTN